MLQDNNKQFEKILGLSDLHFFKFKICIMIFLNTILKKKFLIQYHLHLLIKILLIFTNYTYDKNWKKLLENILTY